MKVKKEEDVPLNRKNLRRRKPCNQEKEEALSEKQTRRRKANRSTYEGGSDVVNNFGTEVYRSPNVKPFPLPT